MCMAFKFHCSTFCAQTVIKECKKRLKYNYNCKKMWSKENKNNAAWNSSSSGMEMWALSEKRGDVWWRNMWLLLTENICSLNKAPLCEVCGWPEGGFVLLSKFCSHKRFKPGSFHVFAVKYIQFYLQVSWHSFHAECKWICMLKMAKPS